MPDPRPARSTDFVTARPRRVRGGLRLSQKDWPLKLSWPAQRWLESALQGVDPEIIRLGHEYARLGQARTLDISEGQVLARVQGRVYDAYRVTLSAPVVAPEIWEQITSAMDAQALFAAKLLAGEFPPSIEELFAGLGAALFPGEGAPLVARCACGPDPVWCKHACCTAMLAAEMIHRHPLTLFTLRGRSGAAFLESLRERRSSAPPPGAGNGRAALAGSEWPGFRDREPAPPLSQRIDDFWEAGPELEQVETSLKPPEVSHALLRRLGPSPFSGAKFPLVGLLATCYDVISRSVIDPPGGPETTSNGTPSQGDDADET